LASAVVTPIQLLLGIVALAQRRTGKPEVAIGELFGAFLPNDREFVETLAIREVLQGLVGIQLGREQKVGAARKHGFADRLTDEES
jgi:hypothetical protein